MNEIQIIVAALVISGLSVVLSGLSMYWTWLAQRLREGRPPSRYWLPGKRGQR